MNAIISLSVVVLITLFAGIYKARKVVVPISVIGLLVSAGIFLLEWNTSKSYYNNMLTFDNFAVVFSVLMSVATVLVALLYNDEHNHEQIDIPVAEAVTLMVCTLIGGITMVSFSNLVMLFLGIEILSIPLYVLAGAKKRDFSSNEAALKYFLLGAFATGFVLFGIALIYGATGSFHLNEIAQYMLGTSPVQSIFYVGIILMLIGMGFKIGAAPFHFWTADVYTGSPSIVTTFMSTVVKTAGIAAFFRLFSVCFANTGETWSMVLVGISALTMFIGNITAVTQDSFKRMLAYSSIAHAGYLLFAIFSMTKSSGNAIFLYSTAYTFAGIMAFTGLIVVQHYTAKDTFDAFNGLAKRNPLLALCITAAMLSLAGIPPMAGFFGKFFIFSTALSQNSIGIVIWAILMSCVSIYYYFRVIIAMYMKPAADENKWELTAAQQIVLAICLSVSIALGVAPNILAGLI